MSSKFFGNSKENKQLNTNLNISDAEKYLNWIISDTGKYLINN